MIELSDLGALLPSSSPFNSPFNEMGINILGYRRVLWVVLTVLGFFLVLAGALIPPEKADAGEANLFPFVMGLQFFVDSVEEAAGSIVDLSGWLEKPAGRSGFIRMEGGHFVKGDGQRIRFLGVNFCFGGCFPSHEEAKKVTRQLAHFGINLVRFHHMDMQYAPDGIWERGAIPRRFDPEQLDRLDYFIAQLKENGIYSNLNLHVSRTMLPEEGYPEPELRPSFDKGLDIYHPGIISAQKDYARALLTHRNPYTGNRYVEEPAVAMIEVTNEDGLLYWWQTGNIDSLPSYYQEPLDRLWQHWLVSRYGTTDALRRAWGGTNGLDLGDEMLSNGDLRSGLNGWTLQSPVPAQARWRVVPDGGPQIDGLGSLPGLELEVIAKGSASWLPQIFVGGLRLVPGRLYQISFWLKADRDNRKVTSDVKIAHPPWNNLWAEDVVVGTEWRHFHQVFRVPTTANFREARVSFTNLEAGATYWVAGVSVREVEGDGIGLPDGEGLEGGVKRPRRRELASRTERVRQDYVSFLWEVEESHFKEMYRFIKQELGARAMVCGTQVGFSVPGIQDSLDYVDAHAYWQHPKFPSRPWDSWDWYIENISMVNSDGGTLPRLAGCRVAGRPYVVSEYNHPAPNTYGSEAFILAGAYGAFQDWDGLVAFAWTHNNDYWPFKIAGFFDIKSDPTKLVTLPAVAALFLRGDIAPGVEPVLVQLDDEEQRQLVVERDTWAVTTGALGLPGTAALERRVALVTAPDTSEDASEGWAESVVGASLLAGGPTFTSDTGELRWDRSQSQRSVVTIDTPRSKAVIGYGGGRKFSLGGVTVSPGMSYQDGWSAITLTVMEGEGFSTPCRILVTATGYAENTGMVWDSQDGHRVSVHNNWGIAPPLVEGIPAQLELPVSPARVRAYALDPAGKRKESIPVTTAQTSSGGPEAAIASDVLSERSVIEIGPQYRTLWYEIEIVP